MTWVICTCMPSMDEPDPNCPWARDGLGHVKKCPLSGYPCPCLPGSVAEAHCYVQANPNWLDELDGGIPPTASSVDD